MENEEIDETWYVQNKNLKTGETWYGAGTFTRETAEDVASKLTLNMPGQVSRAVRKSKREWTEVKSANVPSDPLISHGASTKEPNIRGIRISRSALLTHVGPDSNPLYVFSCHSEHAYLPKMAGFHEHSNSCDFWWTEDSTAAHRLIAYTEDRTRKLLSPEEYGTVSWWDRLLCSVFGHSTEQEEVYQDARLAGLNLTCTRCGHVEERTF